MSLFKSDKIPYFLVLLFAISSWLITHVVDRLTSAPYLAYSVEKKLRNGNYKLKYTINNISYDKKIEEIDFLIIPEPYQKITILESKHGIPAPIKQDSTDLQEKSTNYYKYHLSNLQPHCTFIIELVINKNETLPLRISSKSAVILEKSNISTFFVDYEIGIYIVLLMIIVGLIILYIIKRK